MFKEGDLVYHIDFKLKGRFLYYNPSDTNFGCVSFFSDTPNVFAGVKWVKVGKLVLVAEGVKTQGLLSKGSPRYFKKDDLVCLVGHNLKLSYFFVSKLFPI